MLTAMSDKSMTSKELTKYESNYSEEGFWKKMQKLAKKAGIKTVYYALVLYYTLTDPATPARYRAVIADALGYLILPMDFIPDLLPFTGLADDWAALIAAVAFVAGAITPAIKARARLKLTDWFGPVADSQLGDLA